MPTPSFDADRIGCLKDLRVQWTTELQQLETADPERAFHMAEALQDLTTVIRDLETFGTLRLPVRRVGRPALYKHR